MGVPGQTNYCASKAGLIGLSRALALECAPRGVRVNVVSPGPVTTPLYGKLGLAPDQLQAMAASIQTQVTLGRFGTPEEIVKVAASYTGAYLKPLLAAKSKVSVLEIGRAHV